MAKKLIPIFATSTFSGGGSFFNDGLYKIEEARFTKYDFNGTAKGKHGDGLVCLCMKLQPVNKDAEDAGEAVVQYWSVGDDFSVEDKGKSIQSIGDYETIWKLCDYAVFVDHLGKAGFDRDAAEDEQDISVLEDQIMEFGKVPSPRTQQTKVKDDDEGDSKKRKYPAQVIVVTDANPLSKGKSGKDKTASKGTSKANGKTSGNEELLQTYLEEKVLTSKNEDGVDKLSVRMGIRKYVEGKGGDADTAKAVAALFNDEKVLGAILKAADWAVDGTEIKKGA